MIKTKVPTTANRLGEIDGIRGWAALSVLLFHLIWELHGNLFPELRHPVLRFILDGPLAVYIFFILSGDALSVGFTSSTGNGLSPGVVVKRYFRLAGPIFFSCLIVYILMKFGLVYNKEATSIVKSEDWLGVFLPFEASFFSMLNYSLFDVFANHSLENSYNPFLWPMGIEMVGSMMIFSLGSVYARLKSPEKVLMVISLFLLLLGTHYSLFFIGVLFGLWRSQGLFSKIQQLKWSGILSLVILLGIMIVDGLMHSMDDRPEQALLILAILFVFTCYSSASIISFMRNSLSHYLGQISFPLYFMHFVVVVSLNSWLIVYWQESYRERLDLVLAVILLSVGFSFLIATGVQKMEVLYLRWIDKFAKNLLR